MLVWLGASPSAKPWLALALTYLIHSLVWAVVTALLVRVRTLSSATRHLCWRASLLGPLSSALLATAVEDGVSRTSSSWYVRDFVVPQLLSMCSQLEAAPRQAWATGTADGTAHGVSALGNPGTLFLTFVLLAGSFGLLRFLGGALLLRQQLKDRSVVTDGRLRRRFEQLRARMGLHPVALTESSAVGSPLVIGRHEVCLPRALLNDLPAAELDSVFSHELAHVERADGIWFPIVGAVQAAFWFYPLNHWLASHFRESAEVACDDRAVELTRDPLGLARALFQVASAGSFGLSAVPTMVGSKGALLKRVERLTDVGAATPRSAHHAGRTQALVCLASLVLGLSALSVQVAQAQPKEPVAIPAPGRSAAVGAATPPNAAEHQARMAGLALRERNIAAELERAERTQTASDQADSPRLLELSQQLRHVRATQAWLEEQFVQELSGWEERRRAGVHSR